MLKLEGKEYPFVLNLNVVLDTLDELGQEDVSYMDEVIQSMATKPTTTHFRAMACLIHNGVKEGCRIARKEQENVPEITFDQRDIITAMTEQEGLLTNALTQVAKELPKQNKSQGK